MVLHADVRAPRTVVEATCARARVHMCARMPTHTYHVRVHTQFHRHGGSHTTDRPKCKNIPLVLASHSRPPRPSSPRAVLERTLKEEDRREVVRNGRYDEKRTDRRDGRRTEHVVYSNPILRHTTTSHPPAHVLWPHSQPDGSPLPHPFVVSPISLSFSFSLTLLTISARLCCYLSCFPPRFFLRSLRPLFLPLHRETSEAINPPSYNVLTTFRETSTGTRGQMDLRKKS